MIAGPTVLILAAGGLTWGTWPEADGAWAEACKPGLATGEIEKFFGSGELTTSKGSQVWNGHKTADCSIRRPVETHSLLNLEVTSGPVAAYRNREHTDYPSGAPIGSGWIGYISTSPDYKYTAATVLVDCDSMPGDGLLVGAETSKGADQLSQHQVTAVARTATESARSIAKRAKCEGQLGSRPDNVRLGDPPDTPIRKANGTCRDVLSSAERKELKVNRAWETHPDRALYESCYLGGGERRTYKLTAVYGPSARHELKLVHLHGVTPPDADMRAMDCRGALEQAYFEMTDFNPRSSDGIEDWRLRRGVLDSFARASAQRHGCTE